MSSRGPDSAETASLCSQLEEVIKCAICLDTPLQPKILPCQHSFCLRCLMPSHSAAIQQGLYSAERIRCPVCRLLHVSPQSGVAGLPTDFRANFIKEIVHKRRHVQGKKLCVVCRMDGRYIGAIAACLTCGAIMCSKCLRIHKENQMFRSHLQIELVDQDSTVAQCPDHPREFVQYYCTDCDQGLCPACVHNTHTFHRHAAFVHDGEADTSLIDSVKSYLDQRLDDLRSSRQGVRDFLDQVSDRAAQVRGELKEIRDQLGQLKQEEDNLDKQVRVWQKLEEDWLGFDSQMLQSANDLLDVFSLFHKILHPLPGYKHISVSHPALKQIQSAFSRIQFPVIDSPWKPACGPILNDDVPTTLRVSSLDNLSVNTELKVLWKLDIEAYDVQFMPDDSRRLICTGQKLKWKLHAVDFTGKLTELPDCLQKYSKSECRIVTSSITKSVVVTHRTKADGLILPFSVIYMDKEQTDDDHEDSAHQQMKNTTANDHQHHGSRTDDASCSGAVSGETNMTKNSPSNPPPERSAADDEESTPMKYERRGEATNDKETKNDGAEIERKKEDDISNANPDASDTSSQNQESNLRTKYCTKTGSIHTSPAQVSLCGLGLTREGDNIFTFMDLMDPPECTSIRCHTNSGQYRWCKETGSDRGKGSLVSPYYVITDQLDRIIISDHKDIKVAIYDNRGNHLLSFLDRDLPGDIDGAGPSGICIDSQGNIYVAFPTQDIISKFTPNGEFVRHVVHTEGKPRGISLTEDRYLAVATWGEGLWLYDLCPECDSNSDNESDSTVVDRSIEVGADSETACNKTDEEIEKETIKIVDTSEDEQINMVTSKGKDDITKETSLTVEDQDTDHTTKHTGYDKHLADPAQLLQVSNQQKCDDSFDVNDDSFDVNAANPNSPTEQKQPQNKATMTENDNNETMDEATKTALTNQSDAFITEDNQFPDDQDKEEDGSDTKKDANARNQNANNTNKSKSHTHDDTLDLSRDSREIHSGPLDSPITSEESGNMAAAAIGDDVKEGAQGSDPAINRHGVMYEASKCVDDKKKDSTDFLEATGGVSHVLIVRTKAMTV